VLSQAEAVEILKAWEAANPEFLDFLQVGVESIISRRSKSRETLETARDRLYENLEKGYDRISKGLVEGKDVTEWEEFWVTLLKEYQRVCEELTSY
jgi:thymidylate kinase